MNTFRPVLPVTNATLETIVSHRSVRDYLDEPVGDAELQSMFIAAQSASTSSNLNAWSAVVVTDPGRKDRLQRMTGGNPFIREAPVFIVWVADFSRNVALCAPESPPETLQYQESTLIGAIDAALAAQTAAIAAESMGLGVCYVGGIRTNMRQVTDFLGLPEFSFPVFGMTVGHPDPKAQAGVRPRLPVSAQVFSEKYDGESALAGVEDLEASNRQYYEGQGRPGMSWKWATRRRTEDVTLMRGREKNSEVLSSQGLPGL